MGGAERDTFRFVCPACGESMEVDPMIRAALIDNGCLICGSEVSDNAFSHK